MDKTEQGTCGYAITFYAGQTGPFVQEYASIDKVKEWADYYNYVVGVPQINVSTFRIRHFDGSELSKDELKALDCGVEKNFERQSYPYIDGLYDGVIQTAINQHIESRNKERERHRMR